MGLFYLPIDCFCLVFFLAFRDSILTLNEPIQKARKSIRPFSPSLTPRSSTKFASGTKIRRTNTLNFTHLGLDSPIFPPGINDDGGVEKISTMSAAINIFNIYVGNQDFCLRLYYITTDILLPLPREILSVNIFLLNIFFKTLCQAWLLFFFFTKIKQKLKNVFFSKSTIFAAFSSKKFVFCFWFS